MSLLRELIDPTTRERRASPENPSTSLSDPAAWLFEQFGATQSAAGVNVNRKTALTHDAVFRAVDLISGSVAKLPFITYKRTDDEGRGRAIDHPAYNLLKYKPNDDMTSLIFRQTLQSHVLLTGNGYAHIKRNGAGRPLSLWPLNPDDTDAVRMNGVLWYVTKVDNEDVFIEASNMLHLRGLGFDGLTGYSVISFAADVVGLGIGEPCHESANVCTVRAGAFVHSALRGIGQHELVGLFNDVDVGADICDIAHGFPSSCGRCARVGP